MSIYLGEEELIVGNQASKPKSSPIYPEYSIEWLKSEFNGKPYHFHERPGDKFFYSDEAKEEILSLLEYWEGKTVYENLRKNLPEEMNAACNAGIIDDTWVSSSGLGNLLVDFDKVLKIGLKVIIEQAQERKSRLKLTEPDEIKKLWFLDAVIISNEAVINFSRRLGEKCRQMALFEDNPARIKELETMAAICLKVPAEGAQTFREAVQSTWIVLLALHLEANGHAISLGRFDQYLYPSFKRSIDTGTLTGKRNRDQRSDCGGQLDRQAPQHLVSEGGDLQRPAYRRHSEHGGGDQEGGGSDQIVVQSTGHSSSIQCRGQ